ncbi:MAG: precorrin-2 C(20)-methyltransferase [Magnetovibrio sp.]|nr:precorrin-2 C(20)-methyltransferase [Magnetovibrio sp.]MBH90315.1 precorrin-2 C(20)-methyltransferase [Magnetovibrio sp.]|tara:strand:- start:492 stop:1199 length:708 start_codon:yes stop_codon:yes gene_type:complete
MSGVLFGLGLGPGDPDLVTIKAATIMREIPVIAYVTPVRSGKPCTSFARSIAEPYLIGEKEEITIAIEMLDDPTRGRQVYDEVSDKISYYLDSGRNVAVLCEGDPLLYGSFMYILDRIKDSYKVLTVPGVSSLSAAAAAANLPLVTRHQTISLIPATLSESKIRTCLLKGDSIAILKLGKNIVKIKKILSDLGRSYDAVYVERASMMNQKILSLSDAPDNAPYFSIILLTCAETE